MPRDVNAPALSFPTGGRELTPSEWARVEQLLDVWKAEVLAAAKRHPARSYRLGMAQIEAFANLLTELPGAVPASMFGGDSATARAAERWQRTYTLHELDDALNVYIGKIKDALLYGLRHQVNPTQVASWFFNATRDASINWRMIARTEMVRANALGRLQACKDMGFEKVWVPPHIGSCKSCKRLLENQVFSIDELLGATNYGRPEREWVATIPLHPQCRHSYLPYDREVYEQAMEHYRAMEDAGLTNEDRIDELFDSSGQLREGQKLSAAEYDAATWKTFDPYAEGLAALLYARHATSGMVAKRAAGQARELVDLDQLRVAEYQRAKDPDKVLRFFDRLRAGEDLGDLKVSRRDGKLWLVDGQHRAAARTLNGETHAHAIVTEGMTWPQEAEACRELVGKALDPLLVIDGDDVHEVGENPTGDFTFEAQLAPVLDPEHPEPHPLDPLLFDGLRLRDDVGLALEQWWGRVAGEHWREWSWLFLPAYNRIPVVACDYTRLRAARPEWVKLADTDLHFALVAAIAKHRGGKEIAPGVPLDIRLLPISAEPLPTAGAFLEAIEDFTHREPLWYLDGVAGAESRSMWISGEPAGEPVDLGKRFPGYAWVAGAEPGHHSRLPLDLADRLVDEPDVAKQAAPANAGVEHWITVHPHGEDDKGQPVLVRNNTDGTMSVIGGAGGSMNYMRLDPKRRITGAESKGRDKAAAAAERAGLGGPASTLTEDERERQEQEFKRNQAAARKTIERAEGKRDELEEQLRALVEGEIGAKWLTHGLIRHADGRTEEYELSFMERKQAMRKLIAGALQTLTMGEQDRKEGEASPYLFTEKHGDFEGIDESEKDSDPESAQAENGELMEPPPPADDTSSLADLQAEQERKINKRLPPLSEEQADAVMRLERQIAKWNRIRTKARGILNAGKEASSAYALEWSDRDVDEAVRKRVEAEHRTIAARELLATTDENTYKASYTRALHQGALDTVDSFTHAVIGRTALSPDAVRLLGPVASAQLIAHAVADRADQVGDPDKLSIDKVRSALHELVGSLEADVSGKATMRARKAMEIGVGMRDERRKSEKGESLWTKTMARSYEIKKLNEASEQLGMAIGGFQAASALQVALEKPPPTIDIPGGRDAGALIDRAKQAGITLKASQIEKTDNGNHVARVPFEDLKGLFDYSQAPDFEHQSRLQAIRTGKGLSREIEAARDTPGMADHLAPEQAQGKMFLLESQKPGTKRQWNLTGTPIEKKSEDLRAQMQLGDVLDFAPGVGKTHTGIAAAMQLMHDEPEMNHRVLVVAPRTALGPWLGTAIKQNPGLTAQVMGAQHDVVDQAKGKVELRGGGGRAHKQRQTESPCHFNIISHDALKADPEIGKKLGCTILITDEAQKYKNERNQRSDALTKAGEAMAVERPKMPSRSAWGSRYGKLERGHEHITREDKVRQFRESNLDAHLFHMDAAKPGAGKPESGIGLPDRDAGDKNLFSGEKDPRGYSHVRVDLDADHKAEIQKLVQHINDWRDEAKAAGTQGPIMGGQPIIEKALLDRPGNAFAKQAASHMAERLAGTMHFDGWKDHPKHPDGANAGDYAKKGMIFNQGVQELRHLIPELEAKGLKVFSTVKPSGEGDKWESVDAIANDKVLADFLAHKGQGVLVTTDLNSTARSLQFGDNNGSFQHGATEMLHYGLPDNNATIQQREARIHRRGAVAPVGYSKLQAPDMPAQLRQNDRLNQELKTQQMAGNSEQLVGGRETLRHRLQREGVAPANALQTADEREATTHA